MKMAKDFIVGLKWKRLSSGKDERDEDDSEGVRPLRDRNSVEKKDKKQLVRMDSVREAFGTIRQRLRVSTRRKKRLINSPTVTPGSAQRRRSVRLAAATAASGGVKMYSPFGIDSPSKTPGRIRMGLHQPKRFNFSSPGKLNKDVDAVAEGISRLKRNAESFSKASQSPVPRSGSKIRTTVTPRRRSPRISSPAISQDTAASPDVFNTIEISRSVFV